MDSTDNRYILPKLKVQSVRVNIKNEADKKVYRKGFINGLERNKKRFYLVRIVASYQMMYDIKSC